MNVNLQVVELEQQIISYGMMDVVRGVTKDRRTIRTVHTRLIVRLYIL